MLDKRTQKGQLPVSASQIAEKKISREIKKKLKRILKREKIQTISEKLLYF